MNAVDSPVRPTADTLEALYVAHLAEQQRRTEHALQRGGYDALLIASGVEKFAFLDDRQIYRLVAERRWGTADEIVVTVRAWEAE